MRILPWAILALCLSTPLQATEFDFRVPVHLEEVPAGIPQARVDCRVYASQEDPEILAEGYRVLTLDTRTGRLEREVRIRFASRAGSQDKEPAYYRCELTLLVPWADPPWQRPGDTHAAEQLQAASGHSPRALVAGPIKSTPRPPKQ